MTENDTEQSRLSGSSRTDSREFGIECDVESCDDRVIGLDDGWEYNRGVVCSSCIEYRQRHHHWPDEDTETCRECILDDGGAVHDCPKTSIDVLLRPGNSCPNCEFELAATDGGQQAEDTDRSKDEIFRVERWRDFPKGEEPACADCGLYRDLIGPFNHDGELTEGGDMVCRECADDRGADLTYCTCGTASPRDITCPGCGDYLGYESRSVRTEHEQTEDLQ